MLPPAPHSIPLASLGHLSWPLLSFRPLRRISLTRGFLKTDAILHFLFNSILSEHYLSWPLRVRSRSAGLFFAFPPLSPLHLLLFFYLSLRSGRSLFRGRVLCYASTADS